MKVAPIVSVPDKSLHDKSILELRNMPGPEAYTPFENFTLIHSLYSSGTSDFPFFADLSDAMKSNNFITTDDSYDASRLEPNSLKDLYLHLLKEEAKREDYVVENLANDAGGRDKPRKRTLSSPSTATVNDSSLRMDLLLSLTDRLYLAYKNDAIKFIQAEERKYRLLRQEIQEINRGEWDARLLHQESAAKKDNRGLSSLQTILRHDSDVVKTGPEDAVQATKSQLLQAKTPLASLPGPIPAQGLHQEKPFNPTEIRSKNEVEPKPVGLGIADQLPQVEPPSNIPRAQEFPPKDSPGPVQTEPPQPNIRQDLNARSQSGIQQENNLSYLPPPHTPNPAYPPPLPNLEANSRRLSYLPTQPQNVGAPLPSPRLSQASLAPQERSSQSPIILPPPPGMLRPSGSPPGPLDALADMAGQQFRPKPSLPSPRPPPHNTSQSHPIQLPQPRNLPPPVYPYHDNQQAYGGVPYPQYGPNQIPNYYRPGNPSGPVYQGAAPHAGRPGVYGNVPLYQTTPVSYSQYPAYPQSHSYYQPPVQPQYARSPASRFVEGRAPVSTPPPKHNPPKPSPINTSVIATKWKKLDLPGPVTDPGSPTRPGPEEISPISDRAPSPTLEFPDHHEIPPKTPRGQNTRGSFLRDRRGKRTGARAGSVASSSVTGSMQPRTRSHSVISHADELSMDNNASSNPRIKPEPPATTIIDEDIEMTETPADEGSTKPARHRRETIRGFESGSLAGRAGIQRKRDDGQESYPVRSGSSNITSNKNSNFILGSRNFPRTSATIMNDISAHKLASMFAKPLTEREAPGYKDLIYRPQDLKSIKSAIIAGSKALVAAADTGSTSSPAQMAPGTPNSKSASSVWVPATADVMPPKGIVNSAQLENELMRMFANAVMFNRDPKRGVGPKFRDSQRSRRGRSNLDGGTARSAAKAEEEMEETDPNDEEDEEEDEGGVVRDTREMFEAVEKSVADWRAAERTAEDLVVGGRRGVDREDDGMADELAGDEERVEESTTTGNKRKRR